jgi:hypothetical protein
MYMPRRETPFGYIEDRKVRCFVVGGAVAGDAFVSGDADPVCI